MLEGGVLAQHILGPHGPYQPDGRPSAAPYKQSADLHHRRSAVAHVLRHHTVGLTGFESSSDLATGSLVDLAFCTLTRRFAPVERVA